MGSGLDTRTYDLDGKPIQKKSMLGHLMYSDPFKQNTDCILNRENPQPRKPRIQ